MKMQVWERQCPQTKPSVRYMEMLPTKMINNMTKLTRRAKETFQMTLGQDITSRLTFQTLFAKKRISQNLKGVVHTE